MNEIQTHAATRWGTPRVSLVGALSRDSIGPQRNQTEDPTAPIRRVIQGQIVFLDPETSWIFVADSNGHRLQSLRTKRSMDPAVSADGRKIAFSGLSVNGTCCNGIFTMNSDGTDLVRLNDSSYSRQATWSPDGKQIAFVNLSFSYTQIYTMNGDGTGVTQVTYSNGHSMSPEWSPDGTKILFERFASIGLENNGIFEMSLDGSNVRQLTSGFHDSRPSWSPDGTRIAFIRLNADGLTDKVRDVTSLFVMNSDGSSATALTSGLYEDANPAWSPDGRSIAFAVISASRTCWDWVSNLYYPCGYDVMRVGLDGVIDPTWKLLSASNLVWQR